jgi:hypothetical protein
MQTEIDAVSVVWFHDRQLRERDWPVMSRGGGASSAWEAIDANHRYNGLLWREADRARRLDVPPAEIAAGQRLIDRYDRKRNDAVESIDKVLVAGLHHVVRRPGARLSSDTAGAIIDRLSSLALHIHHMRGQALGAGEDGAHVAACAAKLECLLAQRHDLVSCLDRLLAEARAGLAYFAPGRQGRTENDLVLDTCLDGQVRESGRAVP